MSPAGRIGLFLAKLAILVPALFWAWGWVQPGYSALISGLANGVIGVEEWGGGVTHLVAGGDVIAVWSALREDGQPADTYDARVLHFYLVPCIAVILAFPGLSWLRRLRALGVALLLIVSFQTLALVVTVEHTYAVTLAEVARRNYTPLESSVYSWLRESFDFLAVQAVPAATLVFLVAFYGPLGGGLLSVLRRGGAAPAATGEAETGGDPPRSASGGSRHASRSRSARTARAGIRRRRIVTASAVAIVVGTPLAWAGWIHLSKVHARQSEMYCAQAYKLLQGGSPDSAASLFRRSIALKPSFASAHAGMGHVLLQAGNGAAAAREFDEALRYDDSEMSWHQALARALEISGRRDGAEQVLVRSVGRWPDEPSLRLALSRVLITQGRLCDALPHLQAFARLAPQAPEIPLVRQSLEQAGTQCVSRAEATEGR